MIRPVRTRALPVLRRFLVMAMPMSMRMIKHAGGMARNQIIFWTIKNSAVSLMMRDRSPGYLLFIGFLSFFVELFLEYPGNCVTMKIPYYHQKRGGPQGDHQKCVHHSGKDIEK